MEPILPDFGKFSEPVKAASSAISSSAAQIFAVHEEESGQGFGSPAASSPMVSTSKHLDFGISTKAVEPSTPATPVMSAPASDDTEIDYNAFIKDTLLWTNPVRSTFYLVSGVALITLVDFMLGHNMPLLTVVCHLTLAQMALNFVRHAVNPSLQQRATWLDSAWTAAAIDSLASTVKAVAAVHDSHLSACSPHKHLMIAITLWVLSLVSCIIAPAHIVLVLYVAAFVLPIAYVHFQHQIDPVAKDTFAQAKAQFEAADRRVKGGAILGGIVLLGCISTVDLVIAGFVLCVFVHSQMPHEIEELGKKVGPMVTPIGNTAAKVGGHISRIMGGAAEKYELTPTPMKKKKQ